MLVGCAFVLSSHLVIQALRAGPVYRTCSFLWQEERAGDLAYTCNTFKIVIGCGMYHVCSISIGQSMSHGHSPVVGVGMNNSIVGKSKSDLNSQQ